MKPSWICCIAVALAWTYTAKGLLSMRQDNQIKFIGVYITAGAAGFTFRLFFFWSEFQFFKNPSVANKQSFSPPQCSNPSWKPPNRSLKLWISSCSLSLFVNQFKLCLVNRSHRNWRVSGRVSYCTNEANEGCRETMYAFYLFVLWYLCLVRQTRLEREEDLVAVTNDGKSNLCHIS